jgi:Patatin-like phospholipase
MALHSSGSQSSLCKKIESRWSPGKAVFHVLMVIIVAATQASGVQRTVYTESDLETALPMGIPGVRAWADAPLSVLPTQINRMPALDAGHPICILALSGGGEHGAFGAGLLDGWSETGRRPIFDIVTGVSTGALMAPFAFLGSAYDQRLKAVYTEMSLHNVVVGNPFLGLFGEGLYSTNRSRESSLDRLTSSYRLISPARWFKEMHVDGGTAYPLFAVPLRLLVATRQLTANRGGQLYIVINNNLDPEFSLTKPKTLAITARAFNTLIKTDFYDTILDSYLFANQQSFQFNLAYIPNAFRPQSVGLVDQRYMIALFDFGRARGRLGGQWQHTPPRLYR